MDRMGKSQYIAVLDVLGFSEIIKQNKLEDIYKRYKQLLASFALFEGIENIEVSFFSDTIIIWSKDASIKSLSNICFATGAMIFQSLENENPILLRGAISLNENYIDPKHRIFLGKGIVEAYEYSVIQNCVGAILVDRGNFNESWLEELQAENAIQYLEVPTKTGNSLFWVINWIAPHKEMELGKIFDEMINRIECNFLKLRVNNRKAIERQDPIKYLENDKKIIASEKIYRQLKKSTKSPKLSE